MRRLFFTGLVCLFCSASCLFAGSLYGDFTDDNTVDINDLFEFSILWLAEDCNLTTAGIDLNSDCTVNFYEFSMFANNWMLVYTPNPAAPVNLMVPPQAFDDSSITLIWSKPSDYSNVVSYNVYQNETLLGNTTKLFYNVTGLDANSSYSFTVKSVNSSGTELAVSNTITQSTAPAMTVFNVTSYGAVGNGTTLNTTAIQNAINACTPGGKVLIPSGTFLSGAIFLKSNMTLQIDGTLKGSTAAANYPQMPTRFEGTEQMGYSSLINVGNTLNHTYGGQISNVSIRGSGTVNGGGSALASAQGGAKMRGRLIYIVNASYVNLQGLTLTNPPAWTIHPVYSTQITIQGITASTASIANGDGCDPDSSTYLYIFNNTFNTGDDCIAIKSGKNLEGYNINMPTSNVRITNCIFNQGHGGVTIGSESSGGVNNVFAQDCVVNGNEIGLRMKTCADRGGTVENITIKDWTMTGCTKAGINIVTNYSSNPPPPPAAPTLPICRNITIENVTVDSTSKIGFDIVGQTNPDIHITNMLFKNCTFNRNTPNKLTYVDYATFTGCTIVGGISLSNCTNIIQN
jgi:exo-poly-alpha-galacturonosidase